MITHGPLGHWGESGQSEDLGRSSSREIGEATIDWYWYCTYPIMVLWETITCRVSEELRSNWASRGILTGKAASSRGDGSDSSVQERVNLGDTSGPLLCTRANSYGWGASLGSKAGGSLGVGTPIVSSTLGLSDKALSAVAGVTGSFLAMSNISRSSRSPLSRGGARHLQSSCTAPQSNPGAFQTRWHTSEGPWPVPPFLHVTALNNPGLLGSTLGGRESFHPNTPRFGRVIHQPFFSSCAAGSLKAMACWSPSTSQTWRSSGSRSINLLRGSAGLGISGHSGRDAAASGASGSSGSLLWRVASSSSMGEVLCSSSAGSKRRASTMSSLLRLIRGAMHLWRSLATLQRTPVGTCNLSAQHCSTQAKGFFPVSLSWNP